MGDDVSATLDDVYGPEVSDALRNEINTLDAHTAASVGDLDVLAESTPADLGASNRSGWTPVMYAAYCGHDHVVDFLLDAGVSVESRNDRQRTVLMLAAMCGNDAVAEVVVRHSASADGRLLHATDDTGHSALFHAVLYGHESTCKLLVMGFGADLNALEAGGRGYSPLMAAAEAGHELVVQSLVRMGANVNYANVLGDNARTVAAKAGLNSGSGSA